MFLPNQFYLSVAEIADRWNTTRNHVLEHIVTGGLVPSVFVDRVSCILHARPNLEDAVSVSGEIWFFVPKGMMTQDEFSIGGGLYLGEEVTEPNGIELKAQDSVLFVEPLNSSISDIRVRLTFIEMYEKHFKKPSSSPESDAIQNQTQRTLAALVVALADKYPAYRHGGKPNLEQISKFAAEHLNEAGGNPPRGWSPATFKKAIESALKNCPLPPTE